jgi:hypothetical protein
MGESEAGFLVWIGYVPVLKYVPFKRKGMTLEKKCPYRKKKKSVQSC